MARRKGKDGPLPPGQKEGRVYRAGGYVRLSVEDGGKPGADTLEAQEALVAGFIRSREDMTFCGMFRDNGRTGTNFRRPGFEALMEEVRAGKIDCIVVKDLSRFGRNYKEAGRYLERVFPLLDVRFVAVNDGVDTLGGGGFSDGYMVPLKNILNEVYSRDISRKLRSTLELKQRRGLHTGSWAPYGYRKRSGDPGRLEPDPETAPVVRRMFRQFCGGWGYQKIARGLNENGVPSPARYHYLKGDTAAPRAAGSRWSVAGVKGILANEVYLGHMVQGRRSSGLLRGGGEVKVPEDAWRRVRGTHEALVDEETFRAARKLAEEKRRAFQERSGCHDRLGTLPNLLRGRVFCAGCGRPLARHKFVTGRGTKRFYAYLCPTHQVDPASCGRNYLREAELLEVLAGVLERARALSGAWETRAAAEDITRALAGRVEADAGERLEITLRCRDPFRPLVLT